MNRIATYDFAVAMRRCQSPALHLIISFLLVIFYGAVCATSTWSRFATRTTHSLPLPPHYCHTNSPPITMAGPLDAVRQLASRVLLNRDFSNSPANHADVADAMPSASLPVCSSSIGAMWALVGLLIGMGLVVLSLWQRHRRARRLLEGGQCNLPIVLWRPRFVNYAPDHDDNDVDDEHESDDAIMKVIQHSNQGKSQQKMASSSITNMLPRMERLGGPHGMYGAIYGLSTRVVHVGHPLPAKTILSGLGGTGGGAIGGSIRQTTSARANQKRRSTFISSSGATKAPAYDHFKNF